jgi:hypothetical protein
MSQNPINIVTAEHVGEYRLKLSFNDGKDQVVDFFPFLSRSRHPDIRVFLDPARFTEFRLEYGDLVWGDYELCFPIMELYRNRIQPLTERESAA